MIPKRTVSSLLFLSLLILAVAIAGPGMAMEGGHKGQSHAKQGNSEGKKGHGYKGGMHASMGLTMINIMPGKTMKFLSHFKSWVEITPEQEPAWTAFSRAIKLQASTKPHMKHMKPMRMGVGPVARAEMQIARAERMIQMKKNTLEAYKALLQVLDDQQTQLADSFLAHHTTGHKKMKKGRGKRGH